MKITDIIYRVTKTERGRTTTKIGSKTMVHAMIGYMKANNLFHAKRNHDEWNMIRLKIEVASVGNFTDVTDVYIKEE